MKTILLLTASNIFMTLAWYGHLKFKFLEGKSLFAVILVSWGIAFFEYCLMVPANRGGYLSGGTAQPVYDGAGLARQGDAVVVTVGYRLGALGFLVCLFGNLAEGVEQVAEARGGEGLFTGRLHGLEGDGLALAC